MKPSALVGIILVILGVLALAYQSITYITQEKVFEVGPLTATVEREKRIPLPPIVGAVAIVSGIVLLVAAARRS